MAFFPNIPGKPAAAPTAPAAPRKFNNPLSRWLENRKNRQKQLEETAVKLVTNEIAANALNLIKQLDNVDFIHTNLPADVLTDRQNETVRPEICSLEWTTRSLIQLLQNDRQTINMDIRPLDEKLMTLVLMLQDFVAHGDVTAARAAADALEVCITEIRCKLPTKQPNLAEEFVKQNTEYIQKWIDLASFAQSYDHICNNLDSANSAVNEAEQKQKDMVANIDQRIVKEPDFADAFFYIRKHDDRESRTKWTKIQREVHMLLVNAKLEDFDINMKVLQSITFENDKMSTKQHMDALRTCLTNLPNVADPNLMNKYHEAMKEFVKEVAASDQRMAETLNTVEELSAAMEQLDQSAGNVLAKEVAHASADQVFEKLQKLIKDQSGETAVDHNAKLRDMGYKLPEEREAQKKANEIKIKTQNQNQNTNHDRVRN